MHIDRGDKTLQWTIFAHFRPPWPWHLGWVICSTHDPPTYIPNFVQIGKTVNGWV